MRRCAALLVAAAVVACLPSAPSGSTRDATVVRVALGTVPRAEVPALLVPRGDALVRFKGKAYRGILRAVATDSGVLIVNHVGIEDYLRGVVPLELGERPRAERAALEAQAIAARSFTVTRLRAARAGTTRDRAYDLVPSTADQVYGGYDAEQPNASAAVTATRGLVLRYGDRVIIAPYSSACGGETAGAEEVWRSQGEPFLRPVSDRMPGREARYYCDIAPRFYWERTLTGDQLDATVGRYLASYVRVPSGGPGGVEAVRVASRTATGRVGELEFRTSRGTFAVRGNDARSVLRTGAGELLPSSYFSVETESSASGIARVVLRGNGFGHGVGLCQWGAIGRARAGQSAREILRTYFPGTTVGPIPSGLPSL